MRWNLPGGGKCFFRILTVIVVWAAAPVLQAADGGESAEQAEARRVLDAAGVRGGLVVHLGSGDGKLTAALPAGDGFLVHGLDTDAAKVRQARKYIQSLGLYGPVSVERFDGKRLPYADNLVNLIVIDDRAGPCRPRRRCAVLAPRRRPVPHARRSRGEDGQALAQGHRRLDALPARRLGQRRGRRS